MHLMTVSWVVMTCCFSKMTIVQRASLDIFDEFKEFIEEDKQRDMLKKRGINIDNVPRRTTNILERASQAFEVQLF